MTNLAITSLYAGMLLTIALALLIWVIKYRGVAKVGLGDGDNKDLLIRIRAQGNFTENVPILLLALGLMELAGLPVWFLHAFGVLLVLSRITHPIGMTNTYPKMPFRVGGTLAIIILYGVAAVTLIYCGLSL